jgi:GNAT superfamily N-acetyltransferase
VTIAVSDLERARRGDALDFFRAVAGRGLSDAEFEWFFDRNPLGASLVSVADDGDRLIGILGMLPARAVVGGRECRVAFSVHAATHPEARGQGVFSRLELRTEELAADAGAEVALGFTNSLAGPILVGKLGWRDLYRMRIWARVLRPLRALHRAGAGGLPRLRGGTFARFTDEQERVWRTVQGGWGNCLVRDAAYLNWRYVETPRDYRVFIDTQGYAVLGRVVHKGVSASVICDLVGPARSQLRLLRMCVREARARTDVAVAVPAPGQRAAYLALGFMPAPATIRVIGKPLKPGAAIATRWFFSLGDTDFV